ncbi:unnamed protein product [Caenorhabditis auriculariae]|uniref:Uncharacterized protein n=1 Tax=Caenorhabditis auriculariae TaxID=2777116 RepID=A0A8S1HC07_9PELO|nr:unnamed protein product [Caenorhabditis auriculariae]
MRLAVVLSLVSSLQIFQQSSVDPQGLSAVQFAVVSSSFPLGKFISTLFLSLWNEVCLHAVLDRCAVSLIFGALISCFPVLPTQVVGRFLMGCGAGAGFVCAPVVLRLSVPTRLRPSNFLFLAAAFSVGTFFANCLPLFRGYVSTSTLAALFSAASGITYLAARPSEYASSATEETLSVSQTEQLEIVRSRHPYAFVSVLMLLNVIRVLTECKFDEKFENCNLVDRSATDADLLPYSFRLLRLIEDHVDDSFTGVSPLPVAPNFPFHCIHQQTVMIRIFTAGKLLRRALVLGGYYLSLTAQFFILVTSSYPFLPFQHKRLAMEFLLFLLPVLFSVPCNTALCMLCEQFDSSDVKVSSRSRCFMWLLATLSTLTFGPLMESSGFTMAFLPYFCVSVSSYLLLVLIFPSKHSFVLDI